MKVIIKDRWENKPPKEEDVEVLFECNHVEDTKYYDTIENVKFSDDFHILVIRNNNSCYGFSTLWDNGDGTYHYDGFGNSGACSIVTALLQEKLKEQQ